MSLSLLENIQKITNIWPQFASSKFLPKYPYTYTLSTAQTIWSSPGAADSESASCALGPDAQGRHVDPRVDLLAGLRRRGDLHQRDLCGRHPLRNRLGKHAGQRRRRRAQGAPRRVPSDAHGDCDRGVEGRARPHPRRDARKGGGAVERF